MFYFYLFDAAVDTHAMILVDNEVSHMQFAVGAYLLSAAVLGTLAPVPALCTEYIRLRDNSQFYIGVGKALVYTPVYRDHFPAEQYFTRIFAKACFHTFIAKVLCKTLSP